MTANGPWWSDDPISTLRDDRLQRAPFAKQIAAVLDQVGAASTTSTVIAVTGPWGSGKTSILRLAIQRLQLVSWRTAWLNPWALSGPDAITHELITSIASAMPSDRASKRIKKALINYGQYATPLLGLLPGGNVLGAWNEAATARREGISLAHMADELAKRLSASPYRVLIIIDDIDRLQPDELLALFRAVRVLGRLPNVHYLIAFDQDTLLHVLTQSSLAYKDEARALAFLEKLVTIRLDQPPIRVEQTDAMLDKALQEVIVGASITPTEDQARRLVQEREELLVPLLTEPRKITRFVAQLHSYLPLVDAEELDIVDFLVLTHLRLAFPRLYQALNDDQTILTAGGEHTPVVDVWNQAHVEHLIGTSMRDAERTRIRLHGAIARLFPEILGSDAAVRHLDRDHRRRDRRASDPDYVSRYFALNSEAEPLSDATLTAALGQWAAHSPGAESDIVFGALSSPASEFNSAAIDAVEPISRLMRRLTARTVDLDDMQCGSAAVFLLSQATTLSANYAVRQATPTLLGNLLPRQPSGSAFDDLNVNLLEQLGRILARTVSAIPQSGDALVGDRYDATRWPFTTLVDALRSTGWNSVGRAEEDPTFMNLIGTLCADTAWEIIEDDLAEGDTAPLNGATVALRLLDETWGQPAVDRMLLGLPEASIGIDHLAARFVEVGTVPATGQQTLVSFSAEDFGARFGRSRVESARRELLDVRGAARFDESDITWTNRRVMAARLLLEWLNESHRREDVIAPVARLEQPVINDLMTTGFVRTGGDDMPDLQVAVGFHLGGTPGTRPIPSAQLTAQREAGLLEAAQRTPLITWLEGAKASWRLAEVTEWVTTDGHPKLWSQVACHAKGPSDSGQLTVPISIQMKSEVGTSDGRSPSLQLAVLIAFKMGKLEGNRRPAPHAYGSKPVPAALTVAELHQVLVAMLGCRETARGLWSDQHPNIVVPSQSETQIVMWSRSGMSRSVDLRQYASLRTSEHALYKATFATERAEIDRNAWSQTPFDPEVAASAIKEWAEFEGFRGLDNDLTELEHRRASN